MINWMVKPSAYHFANVHAQKWCMEGRQSIHVSKEIILYKCKPEPHHQMSLESIVHANLNIQAKYKHLQS